jgi:hypothetical protein
MPPLSHLPRTLPVALKEWAVFIQAFETGPVSPKTVGVRVAEATHSGRGATRLTAPDQDSKVRGWL